MLLMRAWGSRAGPADAHDARPLGASVATQKTTKKEPFTGGTRGSAALASGLILLRRRPEASKAIPGTTRARRSAFARSFGDLALPDLMAAASAADPWKEGRAGCRQVASSRPTGHCACGAEIRTPYRKSATTLGKPWVPARASSTGRLDRACTALSNPS